MACTTSRVSLSARARAAAPARRARVACAADGRRAALAGAALFLAGASKARAEEEAAEAAAVESTGNALVDALLVRSADNKALNDKKRLATSYANLARSRTVTDGTCAFPDNLIGCENKAEMGGVKWISDDLALECEGVPEGELCASKAKGSFPSFLGV